MLTALVVIPLVGALITLALPKEKPDLIKRFSLVVSVIPLILVALMLGGFQFGSAEMQYVVDVDWIPTIGASFKLGVDGLSYPMLWLTGIVSVLAIVASWTIDHREKEFFAWMLALQTAMYGVFLALDYLLFFVFWELLLVPMYFIIGIWGGERREYAAIKFFIYTLAGSAILLVGILAVYLATGAETFDIVAIMQAAHTVDPRVAFWIFLAFFIGFAVKVPVWPFHTWLPDAHVEAPTGGSMILAGVLLKTGAYAFFRIAYPTFPQVAADLSLLIGVLGLIGIIYGALAAMAQQDVKKLVAYSSVSHMGFVMLGLAAGSEMAMNGAMYVMVSHGLISPLMFFLVGSVFYDRTHTRMMGEMSGLFTKMPVAATVMAFAAFANLGLPGLSGFVGEFFTLVGSFESLRALVIIAALGLAVTAGYHLWMMRRVLMGTPHTDAPYVDITGRELVVGVPLMALILVLGVYPSLLLSVMNPSVVTLATRLGGM
ncbi:MAG: NADH-quinone oxidoreductase subunit M [Firmicutes bacterium]|nr:NADH-quinone oxidoreductase subunit M [Bacillota bacterium]